MPLLLAFVLAIALPAWLQDRPPTENAALTKPDLATFTPAARKVANRFIATAVARRDRAAWRLLNPDFNCGNGMARKYWRRGNLHLAPAGRFRMKDVSLSLAWRHPNGVSLNVDIKRPRKHQRFLMVLKRRGGDHWLVDSWDFLGPPPRCN